MNMENFFFAFFLTLLQPLYGSAPTALFSAARPQKNHVIFSLSKTPPDDPLAQMRPARCNQGYYCKKTNYHSTLVALEYALNQQRYTPYYQKRSKALDNTRKNSKRIRHTTMINHDVSAFAQKYDIALRDLTHTKLNSYEYQLHKEFLQQLSEVTELKRLYKQAPDYIFFIDAIGHGIALGVEANHNKQTVAAGINS